MKTITKITLSTFTALFLAAGSVLASDGEWISNHRGSEVYVSHQSRETPTVAVFTHGKSVGGSKTTTTKSGERLQHFTTPQAAASFYAPAE